MFQNNHPNTWIHVYFNRLSGNCTSTLTFSWTCLSAACWWNDTISLENIFFSLIKLKATKQKSCQSTTGMKATHIHTHTLSLSNLLLHALSLSLSLSQSLSLSLSQSLSLLLLCCNMCNTQMIITWFQTSHITNISFSSEAHVKNTITICCCVLRLNKFSSVLQNFDSGQFAEFFVEFGQQLLFRFAAPVWCVFCKNLQKGSWSYTSGIFINCKQNKQKQNKKPCA